MAVSFFFLFWWGILRQLTNWEKMLETWLANLDISIPSSWELAVHISQEFWAENKVFFVGQCHFSKSSFFASCVLFFCPVILIHDDICHDSFIFAGFCHINWVTPPKINFFFFPQRQRGKQIIFKSYTNNNILNFLNFFLWLDINFFW